MGSERVDTGRVNTGQDGQTPDARVPNEGITCTGQSNHLRWTEEALAPNEGITCAGQRKLLGVAYCAEKAFFVYRDSCFL